MRRLWHHPARRLGMQLGVDALGLGLAYHLAFFLRFNMDPAPRYIDMSLQTLPVVVLSTLFCLLLLRIYKVMWRYLSLTDLVQLAKALLAGTLVATVVLALWTRLEMYPRTVLPIYVLLGVCLLSSTRMIGRSWFERGMKLRRGNPNAKRVLLIGAGRAAEMLLNELRSNRENDIHVVGLLDDDPVKRNRLILGAPVLGRIEELQETLRDQNIERVVFCIPSAANSLRLSLLESCSDLGVTLETLPRIADLAAGKVTVTQIREVTLEDLLGRDPVALDERAVAQFLNGKVVMITGAGGSIGSEICRQVMNYGPSAVLLFERSELALFTIDGQLRRLHPGTT
ncbi:MAG: polysaccharide biosynthesis protein, partial [Myxococcota bacterium]|nr:polysaccharide biosynthesis protein [Myxococcota bacterium]